MKTTKSHMKNKLFHIYRNNKAQHVLPHSTYGLCKSYSPLKPPQPWCGGCRHYRRQEAKCPEEQVARNWQCLKDKRCYIRGLIMSSTESSPAGNAFVNMINIPSMLYMLDEHINIQKAIASRRCTSCCLTGAKLFTTYLLTVLVRGFVLLKAIPNTLARIWQKKLADPVSGRC